MSGARLARDHQIVHSSPGLAGARVRNVFMAKVYFGGPDKPSGFLRDLLKERVDLVPAGGEILWATYYFRDVALADALIRARERGVAVTLCIEAMPRLR